jgi:dolichol-phosphate mannosyltransferase
MNIDLSVIVPMFNEQEVIEETIASIVAELESLNLTWELILVNDGSTDGTLDLCRRFQQKDDRIAIVDYFPNRGRGFALRSGFKAARGDRIVTIDADLTYSPEHISKLWKELQKNEADIIVGSPYMRGGQAVDVPPRRLLLSRLGNIILSFAFPGKIRTITGILRGYNKEVLDSLELESDGKEIHLEIISKALSVGYRVKEIPAVLKGRTKGKSKFKFRATSTSHLIFSFYQKPMIIFGFLGLLMVLGGFILGIKFVIMRYMGTLNPTRPLSTLMILLLLGGIQMLSFGFIANQIGIIKKEIYKIQKENKTIEKKLGGKE